MKKNNKIAKQLGQPSFYNEDYQKAAEQTIEGIANFLKEDLTLETEISKELKLHELGRSALQGKDARSFCSELQEKEQEKRKGRAIF